MVERQMSECGEAPCGSMLDSYSQESSLIWSDMERCVAGIFELSNFWPRKGCGSLGGMIVPQPIEEIPREKLIAHVAGKKIVAPRTLVPDGFLCRGTRKKVRDLDWRHRIGSSDAASICALYGENAGLKRGWGSGEPGGFP